MPDYRVSGEQLTAIANAIREKTGSTGSLTFPGGFTEGISGIETGGSVDALIDGSITEIRSNVTTVSDYVFRGHSDLTIANFPVATYIGTYSFYQCTSLVTANFPMAETIKNYAFYACTALENIDFSSATATGSDTFYNCRNLTAVKFPMATTIGTRAFAYCSKLVTADFPMATNILGYSFKYCTSLASLIFRGETVVTIPSTNPFDNSKIKSGNGYIYVPAALVDTYKTANYWITFANQFRALEDYTVDGTTTGELDSSKI